MKKALLPLAMLVALPAAVFGNVRMHDQGGNAYGAGNVQIKIEFAIPDTLFRLYWRVSIPDPSLKWGGFHQTTNTVDIEATRPFVLYEDQEYENFIIRWYRWDNVPAGTFTITYTVNFLSRISFYGREPWENDAEQHEGTYWVLDRSSSCISCYEQTRLELYQDSGVDDHLCGTWAGIDLATALGVSTPGDCSDKAYAVASILRGWNIPTGQPTGIILPGTADLGGMNCNVDGAGGLHVWIKHWCDDEQEWHFLEPRCIATGQSPQAFCWGDEADERWTVWAWDWVVDGDDPEVASETLPIHTMEMSWWGVNRVSYREAPTNASGLDEFIASQCFNSSGKRGAAGKRTDAPNCDSHTMVGVPLGTAQEWDVQVIPNPTMQMTRILSGSESASVKVFDVRGRRVYQGNGSEVRWNLKDSRRQAVAPGVYFVKFSDGNREATRKMIVLR